MWFLLLLQGGVLWTLITKSKIFGKFRRPCFDVIQQMGQRC